MNTAAEIGKMGERLVIDRLRAEGCIIMERNWRHGRYEIDIIASKGGCVLFVEVKTRSVTGWCSPEEAITPAKCRALTRAATAYIAQRHIDSDIRFDLAAVDIFPDGSHQIRYTQSIAECHW